MILLLVSFKLGSISMATNLLPIILVMGLIGLLDINLDITTLFIGSIAIGLVVDDTIHFMYNFRKYYDISSDADTAIRETMLGTGRALFITSIVLSTNFLCLVLASLDHIARFGIFTGITIIFALLADFLLASAILTIIYKRKSIR